MKKCLIAVLLVAVLVGPAGAEAKMQVEFNGNAVLPSNGTAAGIWLFHDPNGTQLLLLGHPEPAACYRVVAAIPPGVRISIRRQDEILLEFKPETKSRSIDLKTSLPLDPLRRPWSFGPTDGSPDLHPVLQTALVEHDWRLQDGIDTPLEPRSYRQAIEKIVPRIETLLADLGGNVPDELRKHWDQANRKTGFDEDHWLALHRLRREIVLSNPLFQAGPLLFAKHVPSAMSHQLTQTYGYAARPGGGLFVLEEPGRTMRTRPLTDSLLPMGNYAHPEISFDGRKIYFAYCATPESPKSWRDPTAMQRRYHLYEINADGSGLRQLTDGEFDDFNPTPLPDGRLAFISTRRGGFHRCGGGPCYVYTLATLDPNGGEPTVISFHETNEWDPSLLHDGRIVYTRWDYVDRDAVFYQQLWTTRQDGSNARIFYGNNTFVPCGIWEARAVPGSDKVMATAAPHHGMTAGSIVMLDTSKGVDGEEPLARLTPDARFPEAENLLAHGVTLPEPNDFDSPVKAWWNAVNRPDRPGFRTPQPPEEERRWPGHCYKSAWPLSENYFVASYSYDRLRGELGPNIPNMFGVYFVDVFGNKELIYRDPNISSVWAKPLAARPVPPVLHGGGDPASKTGTFYLQNVYESWPKLPDGSEDRITALRIVQVLPKTTPHANQPTVGAANASPGKQVLGTVPVEPDGSAYFEVPAKIPVLFQALDHRGRAVQTMRSLTYLQPGEQTSCIGCHENRMQTFSPNTTSLAMKRPPSTIKPGPDGSRPFSYPILVQPVLDRHCTSCHDAKLPEDKHGKLFLTGEPDGRYTKSYNHLIGRVSYTAWGMAHGNYEPLTEPNRFGARASKLVTMLDAGHYDVKLSDADWDRLTTWIDANALFYGTFAPEDQARQQRGERIEGPALE